jgi:hypothetical protein
MYVYGAVPPFTFTVIVPLQLVAVDELVDVVVIPNPEHPAVIVNVNVTGVLFVTNETLYVPGHKKFTK